jgi:hypothetical protein
MGPVDYDPKICDCDPYGNVTIKPGKGGGVHLTAAELAHFNGRPKKADRLPRMRTEAGADDKATASRDRRHADGGHMMDGGTVRRSDINHAP